MFETEVNEIHINRRQYVYCGGTQLPDAWSSERLHFLLWRLTFSA
jgi:hypothetical protein